MLIHCKAIDPVGGAGEIVKSVADGASGVSNGFGDGIATGVNGVAKGTGDGLAVGAEEVGDGFATGFAEGGKAVENAIRALEGMSTCFSRYFGGTRLITLPKIVMVRILSEESVRPSRPLLTVPPSTPMVSEMGSLLELKESQLGLVRGSQSVLNKLGMGSLKVSKRLVKVFRRRQEHETRVY